MKHVKFILLIMLGSLLFSFLQYPVTGIYGRLVFYPLTSILILSYGLIHVLNSEVSK